MKTTFFGLTSFEKSMGLQNQAYQLVQMSGFPVVLGFEYYPVVTLGKRAAAAEELIDSLEDLQALGFEVVETDRGGQATLHSPGQLVIYPLVPIQKLKISVRDFVQLLEESTIQWLQKYKIKAFRKEDAGVFTERGKIAFIGIRVERGITRHGISINLSNDLNLFGGIRSCGQVARALDSVFEHQVELELKQAFDEWILFFTSELLAALPAQERGSGI
jgi:lipoyl(octanoyl) transferase